MRPIQRHLSVLRPYWTVWRLVPAGRPAVCAVCLLLAPRMVAAQNAAPGNPIALKSATRDLNGLLLNPTWTRGDTIDLDKTCGVYTGPGYPGYRSLLLRDSTCYAGAGKLLRLVEPRQPRAFGAACLGGNTTGTSRGHVNWDVVTVTGVVDWLDASPDGDFNFALKPDTAVAVTIGNQQSGTIELEFNAYETVARMDSLPHRRWWNRLVKFANRRIHDSASFERLPGIVTGLFGTDGIHGAPVELHPVFAIFLRTRTEVRPGERRERWAFFVRNLGDEGMCSYGQVPFVLGHDTSSGFTYRALIPGPRDADSVWIDWRGSGAWVATTNAAVRGPYFRAETERDVEVSVHLPAPARERDDALMYGEFELRWRVPSAPLARAPMPRPRRARAGRPRERRPEDRMKRADVFQRSDLCSVKRPTLDLDIGKVRTHLRSCATERSGEPAHGVAIVHESLSRAPERIPQATEVWSDKPGVIVCGDDRFASELTCRRRHRLDVAIGYVADPSGPHLSSVTFAPVDLGPGDWGPMGGLLGTISSVVGLRPVTLGLDWYREPDSSGVGDWTYVGSLGPGVYFSAVPVPLLPDARIEFGAGPLVVTTIHTGAVQIRPGAFASAGIRGAFSPTAGFTVALRRMARYGPDTWCFLFGAYGRAWWW